MSKPPTIDRKELKNPDAFVRKGHAFMSLLMSHRKRFIPVAVAGVVAIIGVWGYDAWSDSRAEKAWVEYYEASKLPADKLERWDKLKAAFDKGLPGRAGLLAAVNLADHYFDEAKKQALKDPNASPESASQAVQWYGKALEHTDLLPAERQLLLINRGESWELQKNWDEAAKDYQSAVEKGGEAKPLALLGIARVHEARNDLPKAIETYEKLAADFSNTEYAKTAKNYLRRLKSPLFNAKI